MWNSQTAPPCGSGKITGFCSDRAGSSETCFPHVLAANFPAVPEKTGIVGRALGFGGEGRQQVLGGAHDFCARLGLDMALGHHGFPRDDLPASAREAHAIRRLLDFNPVDLGEADILEIYEAAY